MEQFILQNDVILRISAFIFILSLMVLIEHLTPRRGVLNNWNRRFNNLALVGIDVLFVRILLPVAVVGMSEICNASNWGILNRHEVVTWLAIIMSLLIMDFAVYCQHVLFHHLGWLWKIHKVHHTDMTFDVTTAIRFHPFEILLSTLYKMLVVIILGPPVIAVIIFEIILSGSAMFNHGNINIPVRIDRWLRYIIVTPDMHRVHHSIDRKETDTNYGFFIPWWDRLFRTYCDQPGAGHDKMTIGLNEFRDSRSIWLPWLLLQPFLTPENKLKENSS